MHNEFNAPDGRGDARRIRAHEEESQVRADREVPLVRKGLTDDVHAWLDGELPETTVRQSGAHEAVDFWNRIGAEMSARREVKTPTHVAAQIMAALPATTPHLITPWYRREMVVTPGKAVAIGTAIAAAAAAVTAAIVAG
jgi:hypothetical protein